FADHLPEERGMMIMSGSAVLRCAERKVMARFFRLACLAWLTMPGAVDAADDDITVVGSRTVSADRLSCERIPLGEADDYKPCIARLPDGELLVTAFHQHQENGGKVREQNLLFRSRDGGRTWSQPERLGLLGREPYLSVLGDGTIFLTGHLLAAD